MKKVLLVLCLLVFTDKIFAQQFSQYNTGSLYDSFENPSQRAFTPDTSKKYATNYLFPNLNFNVFLTGDAQASLKSRLLLNKYDNAKLVINQGRYNTAIFNANAYLIMFKVFTSLTGDEEMGFSWQLKGEGKGSLTDESIATFNGTGSFVSGNPYTNIFNDNYYYQTYHQVSFTYREKFNNQFAFGVKLSALLGIQYQKLDITNSSAVYDSENDTVGVGLKGKYYQSYVPGHFLPRRDYLPTLRNPGAAISIGTTYRTEDNFVIQGNLKDLGFIHWSSRSNVYNFDNTTVVHGLSTPAREDSIYNKVYEILRGGTAATGSFTSSIDGRLELAVNKSYWLDDDRMFKYSPTAIASKELFSPGFIIALTNPFQYEKYVFTLTTSYDDLKILSLGAQLMAKTANWEFYIGSDKLAQTASLIAEAANKGSSAINQNSAYTGGDIFVGFSMKFGPVIEHPMNASVIPTGEKGFLARLWARLFKTTNQ